MPINDVQDFYDRALQAIQLLLEGKSTKLLSVGTRSVEHPLTHFVKRRGILANRGSHKTVSHFSKSNKIRALVTFQ